MDTNSNRGYFMVLCLQSSNKSNRKQTEMEGGRGGAVIGEDVKKKDWHEAGRGGILHHDVRAWQQRGGTSEGVFPVRC